MLLLAFSIDNPDSFENVTDKWFDEVKHYCPTTPVILVGTKSDVRGTAAVEEKLRARRGRGTITKEEGQNLANKLGVYAYIECSAMLRNGLDDVIKTAVTAALENRARAKKGGCCTIS